MSSIFEFSISKLGCVELFIKICEKVFFEIFAVEGHTRTDVSKGLMFIAWKYNTMNKSRLWSQNLPRQICKVFVFVFIKHWLKRRNVLHIGCLVEKVINHILLIWTIKFNVKQVKHKPLEVCITRIYLF